MFQWCTEARRERRWSRVQWGLGWPLRPTLWIAAKRSGTDWQGMLYWLLFVLFCFLLSCLVMSCQVLPCLALPCFVLSCLMFWSVVLVLLIFVLFYFILPCLVFSGLVLHPLTLSLFEIIQLLCHLFLFVSSAKLSKWSFYIALKTLSSSKSKA